MKEMKSVNLKQPQILRLGNLKRLLTRPTTPFHKT